MQNKEKIQLKSSLEEEEEEEFLLLSTKWHKKWTQDGTNSINLINVVVLQTFDSQLTMHFLLQFSSEQMNAVDDLVSRFPETKIL